MSAIASAILWIVSLSVFLAFFVLCLVPSGEFSLLVFREEYKRPRSELTTTKVSTRTSSPPTEREMIEQPTIKCSYRKCSHHLLLGGFLLIIFSALSGPLVVDGQYLSHPKNLTVMFGGIAEFECSKHNCTEALRIYVNGETQVAPMDGLIDSLDSRVYNASVYCINNTVLIGRFWIFINNITLHQVKYVTCRIDDGASTRPVISKNGYIIAEPSCTPCFTEEYPVSDKDLIYTNDTNCTLSDGTLESRTNSAKMFMSFFLMFTTSVLTCSVTLM